MKRRFLIALFAERTRRARKYSQQPAKDARFTRNCTSYARCVARGERGGGVCIGVNNACNIGGIAAWLSNLQRGILTLIYFN